MSRPFDPQPISLTGSHVRLEPLGSHHATDLHRAAQDAQLWRFMPIPMPATEAQTVAMIDAAVAAAAGGCEVPFAIVDAATGRALGSTRFLAIERAHRGLEIGWTWLGRESQRTSINTECKLLLLQHAFEDLGAMRVLFKTDRRNEQSRAAILRLGARFEGELRKHRCCWDGTIRSTVLYSLVDDEWPRVRELLHERLC